MSVRRDDNGTIFLDGNCSVEDAEPLFQLLQATPAATIDWTRCTHLHTALVQLLLVVGPTFTGPCGDSFVDRWLSNKSL